MAAPPPAWASACVSETKRSHVHCLFWYSCHGSGRPAAASADLLYASIAYPTSLVSCASLPLISVSSYTGLGMSLTSSLARLTCSWTSASRSA